MKYKKDLSIISGDSTVKPFIRNNTSSVMTLKKGQGHLNSICSGDPPHHAIY